MRNRSWMALLLVVAAAPSARAEEIVRVWGKSEKVDTAGILKRNPGARLLLHVKAPDQVNTPVREHVFFAVPDGRGRDFKALGRGYSLDARRGVRIEVVVRERTGLRVFELKLPPEAFADGGGLREVRPDRLVKAYLGKDVSKDAPAYVTFPNSWRYRTVLHANSAARRLGDARLERPSVLRVRSDKGKGVDVREVSRRVGGRVLATVVDERSPVGEKRNRVAFVENKGVRVKGRVIEDPVWAVALDYGVSRQSALDLDVTVRTRDGTKTDHVVRASPEDLRFPFGRRPGHDRAVLASKDSGLKERLAEPGARARVKVNVHGNKMRVNTRYRPRALALR